MNAVSYALVGLCAVLFGIVSFDLIKLFAKKKRSSENETQDELPE